MSDFEDYAYSPYDDFEDILYDADPAPELADDLAEHAVHSPVYEGEVAGSELQDYFSDWEYYSDDYVDDDPVLLRGNPQVGSPLKGPAKKGKVRSKVPKRGKKRKLAETADQSSPEPEEVDLISRCIRGTVWAKPTARGPPPYKEGQDGKVALMKNWREVFAITDSGWGRSQRDEGDDESWAKDMSLEDMGLKTVQGPPVEQDGEPEEVAYNELLQDEGEEQGEEAEELAPTESPGTALPVQSGEVSGDELPRKRRRMEPEVASPLHRSTSEVVETETAVPSPTTSKLSSQEPADKVPDKAAADDVQVEPVKAPTVNGLSFNGGRKRKATEDAHNEEPGPLKSTASSRAKRVASTKSKATSTAPTTRRQTRNARK